MDGWIVTFVKFTCLLPYRLTVVVFCFRSLKMTSNQSPYLLRAQCGKERQQERDSVLRRRPLRGRVNTPPHGEADESPTWTLHLYSDPGLK